MITGFEKKRKPDWKCHPSSRLVGNEGIYNRRCEDAAGGRSNPKDATDYPAPYVKFRQLVTKSHLTELCSTSTNSV